MLELPLPATPPAPMPAPASSAHPSPKGCRMVPGSLQGRGTIHAVLTLLQGCVLVTHPYPSHSCFLRLWGVSHSSLNTPAAEAKHVPTLWGSSIPIPAQPSFSGADPGSNTHRAQ